MNLYLNWIYPSINITVKKSDVVFCGSPTKKIIPFIASALNSTDSLEFLPTFFEMLNKRYELPRNFGWVKCCSTKETIKILKEMKTLNVKEFREASERPKQHKPLWKEQESKLWLHWWPVWGNRLSRERLFDNRSKRQQQLTKVSLFTPH